MEKPVKKVKLFCINVHSDGDGTIIARFVWVENDEKHVTTQEFKHIFELSDFLKASLAYLSTISE